MPAGLPNRAPARAVLLAGVLVLEACAAPAPGPTSPPPAPRAHHQLVYHAGEERVYLIGGSTRRGDGYHYFDEVWAWNGEGWTRAPSLPFPRSSHRLVHHERRGSLVLFGGGFGGAVRAEGVLWERTDAGWKAVGGNHRAARSEPGLCYDAGRGRVVVFGGWDAAAGFRGDTWEWTGDDLVRVDSTGPSPRAGHAFLLDPVRGRCLLFGGRDADGFLADTWEWDGHRWERLATGGPSPRSMAKLAFDGSTVLLFGGRSEAPGGFHDHGDTWTLRGDSWVRH